MILKPSTENIIRAADELKKGNIVAFPTETVYGLGADCTNPIAVSKIFEAKNRPTFNPLIVHIADHDQLNDIAIVENKKIHELIENFWPGPLTIVLPKKNIIPDIVTSGHSTVAVRMPSHKVALQLIQAAGKPIAAPSANSFGFLSPTIAEHVEKQLGEKVNIILDGGRCGIGVESTIIEFKDETVRILRPGGLAIEVIARLFDDVKYASENTINPQAPGMLNHHYAPKIQTVFIDEVNLDEVDISNCGALLFDGKQFNYNFKVRRILSSAGELHAAAANLFQFLHELENEQVDLILAEKIPLKGLGIAIMDRLQKAVNRYK